MQRINEYSHSVTHGEISRDASQDHVVHIAEYAACVLAVMRFNPGHRRFVL
jgi:hypothetical protein